MKLEKNFRQNFRIESNSVKNLVDWIKDNIVEKNMESIYSNQTIKLIETDKDKKILIFFKKLIICESTLLLSFDELLNKYYIKFGIDQTFQINPFPFIGNKVVLENEIKDDILKSTNDKNIQVKFIEYDCVKNNEKTLLFFEGKYSEKSINLI